MIPITMKERFGIKIDGETRNRGCKNQVEDHENNRNWGAYTLQHIFIRDPRTDAFGFRNRLSEEQEPIKCERDEEQTGEQLP